MNLFISLLYFLTSIGLWRIEIGGIKKRGPDAFHILIFFYFVYILVPSVIIHAILFIDPAARTGVYFFDSVFKEMEGVQSITIFMLNIIFIISFYFVRFCSLCIGSSTSKIFNLDIRLWMVFIWLFFGAVVCGTFYLGLGEDFLERYANLILFRLQDESSDRNFFSANAFALTQTFSWFSAGLGFVAYKKKQWFPFLLLMVLTAFFSFLMGSRRAFIFPFLIAYFCKFLDGGKICYKRIIILIPIAIIWIAFGKELTGSFAVGNGYFQFGDYYQTFFSGMLRAFSDIGISQLESYATLQHFDFSPRFGIDHILSFLRRIPAKSFMGLNESDFPERITRITTSAFTTSTDDDIPPGMLGASWLDFPFLGAIAWGLVLGVQTLFVERIRRAVGGNPFGVMLVVLLMVIVAMPINTGSYDFTVSVDIVALLFISATSIRIGRPRLIVSKR